MLILSHLSTQAPLFSSLQDSITLQTRAEQKQVYSEGEICAWNRLSQWYQFAACIISFWSWKWYRAMGRKRKSWCMSCMQKFRGVKLTNILSSMPVFHSLISDLRDWDGERIRIRFVSPIYKVVVGGRYYKQAVAFAAIRFEGLFQINWRNLQFVVISYLMIVLSSEPICFIIYSLVHYFQSSFIWKGACFTACSLEQWETMCHLLIQIRKTWTHVVKKVSSWPEIIQERLFSEMIPVIILGKVFRRKLKYGSTIEVEAFCMLKQNC